MADQSQEAPPCEWKSQSLISKFSASLQLSLEVPAAMETFRLRMRTGWSSLKNKLFITLFEQQKQHLWHSCCPISLVISNLKFNRKLSEQFWRIWCFPIQSKRSCTWMPERRFKDGRRVTWLVLKRLCVSEAVSGIFLHPPKLRPQKNFTMFTNRKRVYIYIYIYIYICIYAIDCFYTVYSLQL